MEIHGLDSCALIATAVLVSLVRLTRLAFSTLRACISEYYEFRVWLRHMRQAYEEDD